MGSLLYLVLFVCVDLTVGLVNRAAFAAHTQGHATECRCLYDSLVIIDPSNAVVISVTNVYFDIVAMLVVQG